jgi:ABC-2 type transport system ATP-binding protein
MIELCNVSKTFSKGFSKNPILENINLNIHQGEFVILKGENGAGKSTLLNLILGIIRPSSGEVSLMGLPPQLPESKIHMGVVLQEANLPENLKIKELVQLVKSYYPNSISVDSLLAKVKLLEMQDAWASNLSGGQKQRLYFALALAGSPDLLILDEPTRNLDDKGYEEFWQQIRLCREQGVTILMVTNNKSDWNVLEQLATRTITLHKLPEAPKNCQLTEDNLSIDRPTTVTPTATSVANPNHDCISRDHLLQVFQQQLWVEILQILRTPTFLLGILLFATVLSATSSNKQFLISYSGLVLLIVAIERLGKRVAIERTGKWLKFLRTTPLPPGLYIATKIVTVILLCVITLLLMLTIGIWQRGIQISLTAEITIFASMILGVIPFAIVGLGLSYLVNPKSYDSIVGFSIPIGVITCGIQIPLAVSPFIQNCVETVVAFSPFYHYGQLSLWASGSSFYDGHLLLHSIWLLWAGVAFGFITIWAYQRDSVVQ